MMNARPFICSHCLCRLKGNFLNRGIKRSRLYKGIEVLATERASAAVTIRAAGASRSFSSSSSFSLFPLSRASSSSSFSSSPSSSWPALQRRARARSYATVSSRDKHGRNGKGSSNDETQGHGYISPTLLSKARAIAAENKRLSEQLSVKFSSETAKRIGETAGVTVAFGQWEAANESLSELNTLIHEKSTDEELRSLATVEIAETRESLASASQSLAASLVPKHPFAHLPCMLEVRPGAGGSEAGLFAGDLLRMYQAYCSSRGLRATMIKFEDSGGGCGDGGGSGADDLSAAASADSRPVQEAILEVESPGAYGKLRCEAGVHRVQRVPATESKGRTHTSAASILVLPSFPNVGGGDGSGQSGISFDDPSSDYYVDPKDVRTDIMRARGAGGQHVNTTSSAVRLTHLPTGTSVSIQETRSQHKNKDKAWQVLRARIAQSRREAREEQMLKMRRSVVGVAKVGRGDKIRTYNWGQQRVTDHRSGLSVHNLDDVMEGGDALERVMDSVRKWLSEKELEEVVTADTESGKV